LLAEHAAWLEREIAGEQARTVAMPPPPPGIVPLPAAVPASTKADVDALFDQYRPDPQSIQKSVKRGCFLYFFAALLLVALGVLAVSLALRRR
jgi:hypothetical protein